MTEKLEKLREYGAEVDEALQRFMNNEALYVKCLNIFLTDDNLPLLAKAMSDKNYDQAFFAAHALKGVMLNLSLTPLYNTVVPLVEALRHKEYDGIEAKYQIFLKGLEEFKKVVAQLE